MNTLIKISFLFNLIVVSSCMSQKYQFESSERREVIEVIPLLRMYKYSCVVGENTLKHKGPMEVKDSIVTLVFPTNFDAKSLSPFPQNQVFIDSSKVQFGSKPYVQIQITSGLNPKGSYGFVYILENGKVVSTYKSSQNGLVEFQIDSKSVIAKVFSYKTLESEIALNGNSNYEITVNLADQSTGSWNGSNSELIERRNYPRLQLKRTSNELKSIGSITKSYYRQ